MICPRCSSELEYDGDFYYCEQCDETYPPDIVDEYREENE